MSYLIAAPPTPAAASAVPGNVDSALGAANAAATTNGEGRL